MRVLLFCEDSCRLTGCRISNPVAVLVEGVSLILSSPCVHHHKATLCFLESCFGDPSINTWQSEFIERRPMRSLLLGRASAAPGQLETRNGTRASELCSDVVTWRWERGMPTWTRGKDGMWACYDNNTTKERRKRENHRSHRRRWLSPPSLPRSTHGRSSQISGIPLLGSSRTGGGV